MENVSVYLYLAEEATMRDRELPSTDTYSTGNSLCCDLHPGEVEVTGPVYADTISRAA